MPGRNGTNGEIGDEGKMGQQVDRYIHVHCIPRDCKLTDTVLVYRM